MATGSNILNLNIKEAEEFDFVVVGAGAGGPACARRLAEYCPDLKIALIESGQDHQNHYPATEVPMAFTSLHFTENDWNYFTVPQKHAKNREVYLPRGRILGGTTTANATLLNRGVKGDWDGFAKDGCTGWDWDSVLPFFRNSESFHPTEDRKYDPNVHGTKGYMHFEHAVPCKITDKVIEAFEDSGVPYKPDMFADGTNEGVDYCHRSVHKGVRSHGANYVSGLAGCPDNLKLILKSHVLRVLIDDNNTAYGVEVEDPATHTSRIIKAKKEVIVACGTYNTPVVLMHSGVGPKDHLDTYHIPVKSDLPGVGSNLQDHLMVWTFYEVNDPTLTNDQYYYPEENYKKSFKEWEDNKTGALTRFLVGSMAYRRFEEELKKMPEYIQAKKENPHLEDPTFTPPDGPHIEYFSTEVYGGYEDQLDYPKQGQAAISLTTLLLNQRSRGTVRLKCYHPLAAPSIDHAYLSDPLDVALFAEGCKWANNLMLKALNKVIVGAWPPGSKYPEDDETELWKERVRQHATTCFHPAGTAKMGPKSDPNAVVDHELKVHGIKNLRVADQSIMPRLTTGHPQHPTYVIGEKCAFMIAEQYGYKPKLNL